MRISANRAFSSGEVGRHSDGPFVVTGILKTQVEKEWLFALSFSPNVLRFPILAQSHKLAVPKVAVRRPFDELELPDDCGLSHRHSTIFAAARPAPQRPAFFSGKFAKGHSLISSGLIFLNNSALDAGVKPLRVRAA